MDRLSDDLITKILDRVPKASLIPLRRVSKRWRRLIDDPFCRKSPLYLFPMFSSTLYCIDPHRRSDLAEIEYPGRSDLAELKYPLGWERIVLLGSCLQVLCIYNEDDGQVAIWNPSTRWCKLLPPADAEMAHNLGPACVYGFGYDDLNYEYVLLRLVQTMENSVVSSGSIYRSRVNAWRRLKGIPSYSLVDPPRMGVFLHGRLHWIMRRDPMHNSATVLVAFDIYTKNSAEVRVLDFIDNRLPIHLADFIDNRPPIHLAVVGGCLCLIIYGEQRGVSAWIMTEYGSKESWDSLFSIPDYLIPDCLMGRVLLQPLTYFINVRNHRRVLLLLDNKTLAWYNSWTNNFEQVDINGMFFEAAAYFFIDSNVKLSAILYLFGMDPHRLYCITSLNNVIEREYPCGWQWVRLLGSCRQFFCISNWLNGDVVMWDPMDGGCKHLPPADAHILDPSVCVYGFGYDGGNNEYVLLRLVQTETFVSAISIYRSQANTWRQLQGRLPYSLVNLQTMGVFLHGNLHWIMSGDLKQNLAKVLVAFDIHAEEYVEYVEVHTPVSIDNTLGMDLAVLEGCLCLIIYGEPMGVDVWIMREYGSNESWDQLFSIPDHPSYRRPVRPLAYAQSGLRVLVRMDRETLVWYNYYNGDVEQVRITGMPSTFDEATCLQF